jgi:hypothetical protein
MAVLSETGFLADLEHVRDVAEIGRYGVIGSPTLIINGQIKATGTVPCPSRTFAKRFSCFCRCAASQGAGNWPTERFQDIACSVQDLRALVGGSIQGFDG